MSVHVTRISVFSGALALTLMAGAAHATPISLTYQGASSGSEAKTVTITDAPVAYPGSGSWPKSVGAYGFNMTDTSGLLGNFLAWCLDVGSFLSTSSTAAKPYVITESPFSNSVALDVSRIQAVFDANFKTVDATNGVQAAGFQLALWNAVYEDDWDISDGAFRVSADSAIIDKAQAYLDAANSYVGGTQWRMTFLESNPAAGETKHQNLVTVSPVPIPAAGGMLLLALGGLGMAARRRKAAKA